MELLIFILVVLLIVGLLLYAVDLLPIGHPFHNLLKLAIVIAAVIAIAQRGL